MRLGLVVMITACGSRASPRDAAGRPPVVAETPPHPADAGSAPVVVDAVPSPTCMFVGALEEIAVKTDATTMMGTLDRISPGINRHRNIKYRAVAASPTSFDLVFVAYGDHDYAPIANWHGVSPPREHMTPGHGIVAHLAVVDGLERIFERDVDLHTGMVYQTRDHSYPCALIDTDFDRAHPNEFIRQ